MLENYCQRLGISDDDTIKYVTKQNTFIFLKNSNNNFFFHYIENPKKYYV